jgi:hypothetical protein
MASRAAPLDVDVNVFAHEDPEVVRIVPALGADIDEEAALAMAARDGTMVASWAGMRIGVFVPSIPFSHEAARRIVRPRDDTGREVAFLSP